LVAGILILSFLGSMCLFNDAEEDSGSKSVESTLASLDKGSVVTDDDPETQNYAIALDRLEQKCGNPRTNLGDMAVVARDQMATRGIQETLLSILQRVRQSIPDNFPKKDDAKRSLPCTCFSESAAVSDPTEGRIVG
jgi:hypothetical protein